MPISTLAKVWQCLWWDVPISTLAKVCNACVAKIRELLPFQDWHASEIFFKTRDELVPLHDRSKCNSLPYP